jgi:DNA repair protein RecN (Recombination protein N)
VVLRREILAEGRSRLHLNGAALTLGQARALGPMVFDLHGQHDGEALLRPETHLDYLDRRAAHAPAVLAEEAAARRLLEARAALGRLEAGVRENAERRDLWEFQLRELEDAELREGEDVELERERLLLAHAERLVEALDEAAGHLEDDETGAAGRLAAARRALHRALPWDETLQSALDLVDQALENASEVAASLSSRAATLEADPARLALVEDRLQVLSRIRKRHGGSLEAALRARSDLREKLAALADPAAARERLEAEAGAAAKSWLLARRALEKSRRAAASSLQDALAREWKDVGLPGARFEVRFEPVPENPSPENWPHRAEFFLSANPGEDLRPLAKVASGGEISRVMLGLKSALAGSGLPPTLLLDEVDSGIGGRIAEVVAEKLVRLSRGRQVLCITHLAAIAAVADHHFQVEKEVRGGRTYTAVLPLGPRERVEELSRMLAGTRVTDVTRKQARELLARRPAERVST